MRSMRCQGQRSVLCLQSYVHQLNASSASLVFHLRQFWLVAISLCRIHQVSIPNTCLITTADDDTDALDHTAMRPNPDNLIQASECKIGFGMYRTKKDVGVRQRRLDVLLYENIEREFFGIGRCLFIHVMLVGRNYKMIPRIAHIQGCALGHKKAKIKTN